MFVVPIVNAKNMEEMRFRIDAPMIKYNQSSSNSCCFSILASEFDSINQIKADNAISKFIEESFTNKVGFSNRIDFSNALLKNQKIGKKVNINHIIT